MSLPLRRETGPALPGLSLRTAIALVLGVWVTCTLVLFHQHSFVAVSRFDYTEHLLELPPALKVSHLAAIETDAAQAAAIVAVEDSPRRPYALVLVANYYGPSGLFLLRPSGKHLLKPLAVLQTECGHSWASWQLGGKRWAAVANYCSKDEQKGVVIYELEPLTSAGAANPDWGFKAAAAVRAKAASAVLHLTLPPEPGAGGAVAAAAGRAAAGKGIRSAAAAAAGPSPAHALAVAEYGTGELVLYGMYDSEDKGLVVSELQRMSLPGVSALAACSWAGGGGDVAGGAEGGEQLFLVGLAYHDKSFATRSAIYRWEPEGRRFVLLQVLATSGAHGGRCFTVHDGGGGGAGTATGAATASTSAANSSSGGGGGGAGGGGSSLFLAVANSRSADGSGWSANSTLWRYDPPAGRFLLHQSVPTRGAHDVQHLTLKGPAGRRAGGGRRAAGGGGGGGGGDAVDVLVFANRGVNEECSPSERSPLLVWRPRRQRWEEAAHLGMSCATGLAAGRLGGQQLLLATGDRNASGAYAGPLTHLWRLEAERPGGGGGGGGSAAAAERRRSGRRRRL